MNPDWLSLLKENHTRSMEVDELSEIIGGLQNLMRNQDVESLNKVYDVINEKSSSISIVCVLRATYAFRDKTPRWGELVNKSYRWIKSRGEDADDVLYGLTKNLV